MAEKKYLDLTALNYYDGKIKTYLEAKDAAVLSSAKSYADGLGVNYDAAGTAQTKVNELANGAVKANTEAIAVLNGEGEGSVKKAVADLKSTLDSDIDAVEGKADAAQAAADAAQGEVDALETLVGVLPEGTSAKTVIEYVNKKTEGIATDAALGELNSQLSAAQDAIDAIEADYLKAADKTELQDQITENANAIDAIEADYLKAADKTELQGNIDAKVAQADYDAKMEEIDGDIDGLQTQINTIMNNPDAEGAINSINEFTQYVTEHGEIAEGFRTDINKNKDDIAAMDTAYKAADTALDNRVKALEGIDHEAYVAADTALKNELNGEIAKKADQTTVDAMDAAYKAADLELSGRLDDVEAALGTGTGSVTEQIANAKQEAIDAAVGTAAADATSKANAAEAAAKSYTDGEIDKVEVNVNKNADDISALAGRMTTAEGEIDNLQAAIGEGGSVTVAIAEAKQVGQTAQNEVDALEGVVEALTTRVGNQESACSAHGDRLTALENKVGDGFVAITNAEIDALFPAQ